MAGGGDEGDALQDLVAIYCNGLGKSGLDHRPHTVVVDSVGRFAYRRAEGWARAGSFRRLCSVREVLAIGLFDAREDVGRVREGRDPATIDETRVPADVIGVNMGEQNVV